MKIFGMVGWRDSGKTTLIVNLLPELIRRGLEVSTIKHTHHGFDIDKPEKDSYKHRKAGAREVLVTSSTRWALMHELHENPEENVEAMIARMGPVDLLLIEGFKEHGHPKMEIHRPSVSRPLLCKEDPNIVMVASDEPLGEVSLPVLGLDDIAGIADFIIDYCGLAGGPGN
ncbi:MAG: molybdopterin-guanine dinucleotide biosynthesis protein B [Rhodospirillales bacterium]